MAGLRMPVHLEDSTSRNLTATREGPLQESGTYERTMERMTPLGIRSQVGSPTVISTD